MKMKTNQPTAWTTKHRPNCIAELHQTTVRTQLQKYQDLGAFPQVLLFAGPKGTGKTTSARIIGALLNDPQNAKVVQARYFSRENDNQQLKNPDISNVLVQKILAGTSFSVHELDAASNRGINEIRDLKDQAQFSPVEGLISVFILDEVHMLTTPAFNALLKLLEEPPAHTTFILATTELQKIPETVVSRCQVVHFHQATLEELGKALHQVAKKESLKLDAVVIARLAQLANGSFRDGVKYLQKISNYTKCDLELVDAIIAPSFSARIQELIQALLDKNPAQICQLFVTLRSEVYDEKLFITQLLDTVHQDLLAHYLPTNEVKPINSIAIDMFLLKEFTQPQLLYPSPIPFLSLEIICLSILERSQQKAKKASGGSSANHPTSSKPIQTQSALDSSGDAQKLMDNWSQFIREIGDHNTTLAALFRSAQPKRARNHIMELEVYYQFHKEQLANLKHYAAIKPILHSLVGGDVHFDISVVSAPQMAELLDEVPASLPEQVAAALLQTDPQSVADVVQSN